MLRRAEDSKKTMNDNEKREAELRLAEDIKVIESLKQLKVFKPYRQFVESYVVPQIRLCHNLMNEAARKSEQDYIRAFFKLQGEIKRLEEFENLDNLIEKRDSEVKGLTKKLKNG